MVEMRSLVYIIILTYNGKKWIDNCLNSVLQTNYPHYKILVIDNASKDGSADYTANKFPQVELIRNKKNYGFAEGNNIGMRYALKNGADHIILLNQDTKVNPDWLIEMVNVAEKNEKIGILSPMQYDYEGKGLDINFEKLLREGKQQVVHENFVETDRVIGAAMLITRGVLQKIGGFDPIYFCYFEESDLCRRVKYFGYGIAIVKDSKIYHWHSLIQENGLSRKAKYLFKRNEFIYALKDPEKSLTEALLGYYKSKIKNLVRKYGIVFGCVLFVTLVIIQSPVFLYVPYIIIRKNKETRL